MKSQIELIFVEPRSSNEYALLERLKNDIVYSTLDHDEKKLVVTLCNDKFCDVRREKNEWVYHISERGVALLEARQEKLQEHAAAERQKRFENKLGIASVAISALTFLLGLLTEHFFGIIQAILRLFE